MFVQIDPGDVPKEGKDAGKTNDVTKPVTAGLSDVSSRYLNQANNGSDSTFDMCKVNKKPVHMSAIHGNQQQIPCENATVKKNNASRNGYVTRKRGKVSQAVKTVETNEVVAEAPAAEEQDIDEYLGTTFKIEDRALSRMMAAGVPDDLDTNCPICRRSTIKKRTAYIYLCLHVAAKHRELLAPSRAGPRRKRKRSHSTFRKSNSNSDPGNVSLAKILSCPYCPYEINNKRVFDLHLSAEHRNLTPFQCATCDFAAATEGSLKKHVLSTHTFKCGQCPFTGKGLGFLRAHVRAKHTGEGVKRVVRRRRRLNYRCSRKPPAIFGCDQCSFVTRWKYNLNKHLMLGHLNVKWSCDFCEFSTELKRCLRWHKFKRHPDIIEERES